MRESRRHPEHVFSSAFNSTPDICPYVELPVSHRQATSYTPSCRNADQLAGCDPLEVQASEHAFVLLLSLS
jgi:hypothetical protein